VWSGTRAQKLQLADAVGSLDDAISKASQLGGMAKINVEYYPKQQSFLDFLFQEKLNTGVSRSHVLQALAKELGSDKALAYKEMFLERPLQMLLPFIPEL
jgi:ClpP class serine protease